MMNADLVDPMEAGRFDPSPGANAFDAADRLIAERLVACRTRLGRPILAGLCGAQGSGKSTTAARLRQRLESAGHPTVVLSLDDFYLTRAGRISLGRDVHPLLETRGVPGTHDLDLALATIDALLAGHEVALPVFDKTRDDRALPRAWPHSPARVSIVILEGWCVAARPMPEEHLATPVNRLEQEEDGGGEWRRHVNAALSGPYRELFGRLDYRVLLLAPGFEHVHAWRLEQEERLDRVPGSALPSMDAAAVARFIAHYERVTRWILEDQPADLVIGIGPDRTPLTWRFND